MGERQVKSLLTKARMQTLRQMFTVSVFDYLVCAASYVDASTIMEANCTCMADILGLGERAYETSLEIREALRFAA
jgi:hypothetical protein